MQRLVYNKYKKNYEKVYKNTSCKTIVAKQKQQMRYFFNLPEQRNLLNKPMCRSNSMEALFNIQD
jgi:hypothetical protein